MHLPPYVLIFPRLAPAKPGLAYGAALALAVRSLFSPIFRVEEDGWNGSGAAMVDVFCVSVGQVGIRDASGVVWRTFSHFLQTMLWLREG
jgi:hypothetical protein